MLVHRPDRSVHRPDILVTGGRCVSDPEKAALFVLLGLPNGSPVCSLFGANHFGGSAEAAWLTPDDPVHPSRTGVRQNVRAGTE